MIISLFTVDLLEEFNSGSSITIVSILTSGIVLISSSAILYYELKVESDDVSFFIFFVLKL